MSTDSKGGGEQGFNWNTEGQTDGTYEFNAGRIISAESLRIH